MTESDTDRLSPPDVNAKPKDYHSKFTARTTYSKHTDPCEDAAKASLKCMDRNQYDKDKCQDFFQAYRDCKRAWTRDGTIEGQDAQPLSSTLERADGYYWCSYIR
ncbi:cysteine alpha-hairpin motif superfamily [Pisolithus croceorrhizus]|nr:cysteine alpha-hairpin motif superfamily [Pisolithus croceorrhizus]